MKIATLNDIIATRARATFSHRINFETISYESLPNMKQWCEENCQGLWRSHTTHALYWQFEEERDAVMFMLRWGGASGNKVK
jgi:hypothetical protein